MRSAFLIILLTVCTFATGQDKDEVKQIFWDSKDSYKSANDIPEKWKNESAVVIYKHENYEFSKINLRADYVSSIRKRIKLLDQPAVTQFSEFSFKEQFYSSKGMGSRKKGKVFLGIKVIKPDGTEKEINIDEEAVNADDKKKVAIPNLEIGDIIDYYYYVTESFMSQVAYSFDPVERTLGDVYPTMNMKLTFKTENDFFVNFSTYNGAPDLKVVSEKGGERRYELIASDIEKNDFPRWFYPLVELPSYKFQVVFARSGKFEEWAAAFLPEKENIIKKTVSKEEVLEHYENKFTAAGYVNLKDFLRSRTFKNDEERVKEVYYYTRHAFYTRYIEAFVVDEAKIMYPYELFGNYPVFFKTDRQFINYFMAFLKSQTIDYDILVGTPRENGPIKDLLLESNTAVVLRVNTANPVYLQFFTPFTNADQVQFDIENSDAYALKVSKGRKVTDVETIKLPASTHTDNTTEQNIAIKLDAGFETVDVVRETLATGHNKDYLQKDRMYFFDYVDEDYAKYGTPTLMDLVKNKKKKAQYTKEFDALKDKLREKQKEEFKAGTESEFGFAIDDHSFKITNTGRYGSKMPFAYTENFKVKNNLIKKAGENYVFEIGKLIGEQVDIQEKEMKRTNNVYLTYPRSYTENIEFEIPAGYTVVGLDKLNKKVENSTGGFESTATIEGNKLIIKAHKYYTSYYEPAAKWQDLVAFLDTAYQFTQEKVLIRKG